MTARSGTSGLSRHLRRPNLAVGGSIILVLLALALLSLVWTPLPPAKMQIIHKLLA